MAISYGGGSHAGDVSTDGLSVQLEISAGGSNRRVVVAAFGRGFGNSTAQQAILSHGAWEATASAPVGISTFYGTGPNNRHTLTVFEFNELEDTASANFQVRVNWGGTIATWMGAVWLDGVEGSASGVATHVFEEAGQTASTSFTISALAATDWNVVSLGLQYADLDGASATAGTQTSRVDNENASMGLAIITNEHAGSGDQKIAFDFSSPPAYGGGFIALRYGEAALESTASASAGVGAVSIVGVAPSVEAGVIQDLAPSRGAVQVTGRVASLTREGQLRPATGMVSARGEQPRVALAAKLRPGVRADTWAGQAVTVTVGVHDVSPAVGAVTIGAIRPTAADPADQSQAGETGRILFGGAGSTTSGATNTASTSFQLSVGEQDRRLVLVWAGGKELNVPTNLIPDWVTLDSVTGTYAGIQNTNDNVGGALWYWLETDIPSASGSYTVKAQYPGDVRTPMLGGLWAYNVEQTGPESVAAAGPSGQTYVRLTIDTSTPYGTIFDGVFSSLGTDMTATAGTTERLDLSYDNGYAGLALGETEPQSAGTHAIEWDSTTVARRTLLAGVWRGQPAEALRPAVGRVGVRGGQIYYTEVTTPTTGRISIQGQEAALDADLVEILTPGKGVIVARGTAPQSQTISGKYSVKPQSGRIGAVGSGVPEYQKAIGGPWVPAAEVDTTWTKTVKRTDG